MLCQIDSIYTVSLTWTSQNQKVERKLRKYRKFSQIKADISWIFITL